MILKKPIPLVVEFASGSKIHRKKWINPDTAFLHDDESSWLDTSIVFSNGTEISLPTDQIIIDEDGCDSVWVGFGGMSFEGIEKNHLIFWRVHDLLPEEALLPQRGMVLKLKLNDVKTVFVEGEKVWPARATHANSL